MTAATTAAFLDGSLDPGTFRHADHVAVAYDILSRHDVFEALAIYAGRLRALTVRAGVPEKFNATVTFAFISLIAQRMETGDHRDADDFLARNPDLLTAHILGAYYPADVLNSDIARKVPVLAASGRGI